MEKIPEYKQVCTYCYKTVKDRITFCCGTALCNDHLNIHITHSPLYSVQKTGNNYILTSSILTEAEKHDLINHIKNYSFSQYTDIIRVECPHIRNIAIVPIDKDIDSWLCNFTNCGISEKGYLCLSCGYVGCSRVQYNCKGNGHALDHFNEKQHFIATAYEDLSIFGGNKTYCYKCNDYIKVNDIREYFERLNVDYKRVLGFKCENERVDMMDVEGGDEEVVQVYCGIENAGNTCYISAVLHLLSFNDGFSDKHFYTCWQKPGDCFICQLIKVLTALRHKMELKESLTSLNKINILDLIERIEYELPIFQRPYQQDSNEFLLFLFLKLKEYEYFAEIKNTVDEYQVHVSSSMTCDGCGLDVPSENESYSLVLDFADNFQGALTNYESIKQSKCSCGGIKTEKSNITKTSKYLILVLNLLKQDENMNYEKNKKDFYAEDTIYIQENTEYRKICEIVHRGEALVTGHYVTEINNYVIDDEKVTLKEEKNGQGYIFLYKRFN